MRWQRKGLEEVGISGWRAFYKGGGAGICWGCDGKSHLSLRRDTLKKVLVAQLG